MPDHSVKATSQYNMYRIIIFCWRCWSRNTIYSPGEFADVQIFRCDRCGTHRICDDGDIYTANRKFLDFRSPSLRGWGATQEHQLFINVFEEEWTGSCECGGRFRLGLWPRCSRCHARPIRWLSVSSRDVVPAPPIPTLRFTIPSEYANAPTRPSLHPEPEVAFVPGPLPDPARPQTPQDPPDARQTFEEHVALLVRQRLETWEPQLSTAGLSVELGPVVRGEETKHIQYSSEYPLIVHRDSQIVEIIRFYVYHTGQRAATDAEFTVWLNRTLQLLTEGKQVSKLVP